MGFETQKMPSPEEMAKIEKEKALEETETPEEEIKNVDKFAPENIEESVKKGEPIEVKVQRSSGEIEEGWIVVGSDGEKAVVIKAAEGGKFLRKIIPLEELKELNEEEIKQQELIKKEENDNKKENKENLKIKFPEDTYIIRALQDKLAEYKKTLGLEMEKDSYKAPETFTDINYKIAVLEKLLMDGEVNKFKLSEELNKEYGSFNDVSLGEAFTSIDDFIKDCVKTGRKRTKGEIGLAFRKKQQEQKDLYF